MKVSKKAKIFIGPRADQRVAYIARHYGLYPQLKKTCEELFELTVAIIVLRFMHWIGKDQPKHLGNVQEEMADVRIMLDQIELLTRSGTNCSRIRDEKLDRQIKRISEEV